MIAPCRSIAQPIPNDKTTSQTGSSTSTEASTTTSSTDPKAAESTFSKAFVSTALIKKQLPKKLLEPDTLPVAKPKKEPQETPQQHDQFQQALVHIRRAEALFSTDNFEASLAEYQQAYAVLQGHPKQYLTLHNIGLCHERLFRYSKAVQYYKDYLEKGGKRVSNRIEIEKVTQALHYLLSTLHILVNVRAEVWIDDVLAGHAPGDILVDAGRHTIELRPQGYQPARFDVSVPVRKVQEIRYAFNIVKSDKDQDGGFHPSYFWAVSSVSVVSIGLGAYFGIQYLSALETAKQKHEGVTAKPDAESTIDKLEINSNIFFTIGGTLVLSSIVLFFLTDWEGVKDSTAKSENEHRAHISTYLNERSVRLNLDARF